VEQILARHAGSDDRAVRFVGDAKLHTGRQNENQRETDQHRDYNEDDFLLFAAQG
jgi:hypothetical protein